MTHMLLSLANGRVLEVLEVRILIFIRFSSLQPIRIDLGRLLFTTIE